MRVVAAMALAVGAAFTAGQIQGAAQAPAAPAGGGMRGMQMQETSRKVPGGGITAAGWKGQVDANEASRGGKVEDSKLVEEGGVLKLNNGPAAIYWNPKDTATGNYTVSATFTEPKYMSSNDHPHPYGLFIGGHKLGTPEYTLLYCAPYGNGTFIVRGFGPAAFKMNGGRGGPNEAVHKAAGPGESVTQDVAMSVSADKVECSINGTVVATYPKNEVVGTGKLESTDGIAGIRAAHNTDVNISNFKITKQ